jgi:hypothetical protein
MPRNAAAHHSANGKEADMDDLRGHNRLKATGILLLFAAFLGALLIVPGIRPAPSVDVRTDEPATAP